jgi:hypothetical protein
MRRGTTTTSSEFEPIALMVGLDSLVLHYRSVQDLLTAELMVVDQDGVVTEVIAHYGGST